MIVGKIVSKHQQALVAGAKSPEHYDGLAGLGVGFPVAGGEAVDIDHMSIFFGEFHALIISPGLPKPTQTPRPPI